LAAWSTLKNRGFLPGAYFIRLFSVDVAEHQYGSLSTAKNQKKRTQPKKTQNPKKTPNQTQITNNANQTTPKNHTKHRKHQKKNTKNPPKKHSVLRPDPKAASSVGHMLVFCCRLGMIPPVQEPGFLLVRVEDVTTHDHRTWTSSYWRFDCLSRGISRRIALFCRRPRVGLELPGSKKFVLLA